MRTLKKQFRNIKIRVKKKPILAKIPIKKKMGRWCEYYEGRLPYPIECSGNKQAPISSIFKKGKETIVYDRSNCVDCKRNVEWASWRKGSWRKVIEAIAKGEDLTDIQDGFNLKERE